MSVPDFFKPLIKRTEDRLDVDFLTWDRNGNDVRIVLGCRISNFDGDDAKAVNSLLECAWQAVWLAAQGQYNEPAMQEEIETT